MLAGGVLEIGKLENGIGRLAGVREADTQGEDLCARQGVESANPKQTQVQGLYAVMHAFAVPRTSVPPYLMGSRSGVERGAEAGSGPVSQCKESGVMQSGLQHCGNNKLWGCMTSAGMYLHHATHAKCDKPDAGNEAGSRKKRGRGWAGVWRCVHY